MLMTEDKSKRQRNPKRSTGEMSEFGKTLNLLMVQHGVYEWKDLLELLEAKAGYEIGQPRLSGYLYGDRNPRRPQELFDALARALELDENERIRLIYSYGYPKGGATKIDEGNIERFGVAEERIKDQAKERREDRSSESGGRGS